MTGNVEIISRTYRKIKGKYYARVRYKIDDGKPLDILRQVENKSAIKPKQPEIEVELLKNGPAQLVAGKVTFRQLAQHAKDNIYVSAVYDDQETKITGFRSVVPAHAALNNLVAFFGDIDIRKINEKKLTVLLLCLQQRSPEFPFPLLTRLLAPSWAWEQQDDFPQSNGESLAVSCGHGY